MDIPEIRYAKAGNIDIAYEVLGDGPVDLVSVPAWATNIELYWEDPRAARFNHRLASFSRLIGCSRPPGRSHIDRCAVLGGSAGSVASWKDRAVSGSMDRLIPSFQRSSKRAELLTRPYKGVYTVVLAA